jgi:hypothetical protein
MTAHAPPGRRRRKIKANTRSITGTLWRADGEFDESQSFLEHCRLLLIRYEPNVESWEDHPFAMEWIDSQGNKVPYTPDLIVKKRHSEGGIRICIEEVKYRDELVENKAQWKEKWVALREWCRGRDWTFSIFTDVRRDRHPHRLFNIRLIRYYARPCHPVPPRPLLAAITELVQCGPSKLNLEQIYTGLNGTYEEATISWGILHLLGHKKLVCDLNERISRDLLVGMP